MSVELTLSIIKPDGIQKNLIGEIYSRFEKAGLEIVASKMMHLTNDQAEGFYAIHRERPFFNDLIKYITSGPIIAAILEKENAVKDFRKLIGSTNPEEADAGTIRKLYAKSIDSNAIHGSDSNENAEIESNFHFAADEVI